MILTSISETPESYDLWIIPISDDCLLYDDQMPLSSVDSAYKDIQSTTPSPCSLCDMSPYPFHVIFSTDEMIMTVMSMEDTPWDNGHHHYILFLEPETIESYQRISTPSIVVIISYVPESTQDVLFEGNLGNISPTIPLDISIKPEVMENVHINASCFANEVCIYRALFQEFCNVF
jgi:hypothetical protein